jgi:DNA-binding transcriptional LysR family regulator
MPELDAFLLPMSKGHKIVVPQAAVRRNWVERGMGIAVTHEEPGRLMHDDVIGTIDLSATLGETELMFYFRKRHDLTPAAKYLVDAIRLEFSDGRKTGTSS